MPHLLRAHLPLPPNYGAMALERKRPNRGRANLPDVQTLLSPSRLGCVKPGMDQLMGPRQVDYDQIAPTYNQRFEDGSRSDTAVALHDLVLELKAKQVLEVGCGTGHWLADLHPAVDHLYGLDLSAGMLHQALDRDCTLYLSQGRGGQLPFPGGAFALVYCVNALHHFRDQASFIRQAYRLLRPGGALAVVGFDPRLHRHKWYVYDFFESTYPTDLERFPSWGTVVDWMAAAGFAKINWQLIEWIEDPKQGSAVLDDPYLQKHATSQLALLSDDEYTAGIEQLKNALAAQDGEKLILPATIFMRILVARTDPTGRYQL